MSRVDVDLLQYSHPIVASVRRSLRLFRIPSVVTGRNSSVTGNSSVTDGAIMMPCNTMFLLAIKVVFLVYMSYFVLCVAASAALSAKIQSGGSYLRISQNRHFFLAVGKSKLFMHDVLFYFGFISYLFCLVCGTGQICCLVCGLSAG